MRFAETGVFAVLILILLMVGLYDAYGNGGKNLRDGIYPLIRRQKIHHFGLLNLCLGCWGFWLHVMKATDLPCNIHLIANLSSMCITNKRKPPFLLW